ncbi:MAG TPA: MFS transporter [Thermoanaerobaculia bacterium]|nr:MFS transporter [Thermoanaerobaculia bacterium]
MSEVGEAPGKPRGMRTFLLIWFGQVVSILGSGLSAFALGVWTYRQTGSATALSLITLFSTVPNILLSPVAGALIDRWGRRSVLLLNNFGSGACTLVMAALYWAGVLQIWHVYLLVCASRCFNVFQLPAFSAATSQLVPRRQLVRANGMAQLGPVAGQTAAPILAAALMNVIGVGGVIFLDCSSFLFAALTLLLTRIPRPPVSSAGQEGRGSLLYESFYGWTYIRQRPGLLGLMLFFAFANYCLAVVQILVTPMVLSFGSPQVLGVVLTSGMTGALLGGITLSVWGQGRSLRRIPIILSFTLLQGTTLLLGGLRPSALLVGSALFVALFALPIIRGSNEAIWQSKIPQDLQGRVFAIRRMISGIAFPLAGASAGPLADVVFRPLLLPGGALAGSVGRVIGVGPGRGVGLMFMLFGVLTLVSVAVTYEVLPVRRVETQLPDVLYDEIPDRAMVGLL